jgi:predicted RNA binding protein YcfA (HicA-like mRNA interferase family)
MGRGELGGIAGCGILGLLGLLGLRGSRVKGCRLMRFWGRNAREEAATFFAGFIRDGMMSMPRKLRQLIADLEKHGFVNRGGKGSHRNFLHPNGVRITLSVGGVGRRFERLSGARSEASNRQP